MYQIVKAGIVQRITYHAVLGLVRVVVAMVICPLPCDSKKFSLLPQPGCNHRLPAIDRQLAVVDVLNLSQLNIHHHDSATTFILH
jgi:hypothetical protein